jgi:hypothetical protein
MDVCCEYCALPSSGLCDELITPPEESYRLWCVIVCDLENVKNEEAMTRDGSQHHRKKNRIKELELSSPLDYDYYLRMCLSTFGELLELIMPLVKREDTNMREAISPKGRLFATLRFLASGLTFENLKFETAIELVTW